MQSLNMPGEPALMATIGSRNGGKERCGDTVNSASQTPGIVLRKAYEPLGRFLCWKLTVHLAVASEPWRATRWKLQSSRQLLLL